MFISAKSINTADQFAIRLVYRLWRRTISLRQSIKQRWPYKKRARHSLQTQSRARPRKQRLLHHIRRQSLLWPSGYEAKRRDSGWPTPSASAGPTRKRLPKRQRAWPSSHSPLRLIFIPGQKAVEVAGPCKGRKTIRLFPDLHPAPWKTPRQPASSILPPPRGLHIEASKNVAS